MEQPEVSSTSLRLRLRDRLSEFDKAHQRVQYLGNNVLPNGLEGTADDIKGKTKPKVYGKVFNIEPMMVNTSKLIYQASDSDVYDIPNVYDKGAALTRGSDYADSAAMLATAPSPGQYKACPSEGYFRLGAAPEGTVTCDVTEGPLPLTAMPGPSCSALLRTRAWICRDPDIQLRLCRLSGAIRDWGLCDRQ